jgi:hypothetical protein
LKAAMRQAGSSLLCPGFLQRPSIACVFNMKGELRRNCGFTNLNGIVNHADILGIPKPYIEKSGRPTMTRCEEGNATRLESLEEIRSCMTFES